MKNKETIIFKKLLKTMIAMITIRLKIPTEKYIILDVEKLSSYEIFTIYFTPVGSVLSCIQNKNSDCTFSYFLLLFQYQKFHINLRNPIGIFTIKIKTYFFKKLLDLMF